MSGTRATTAAMAPTITLTTVHIIGAKIAKGGIPKRRQKAETGNSKLETGNWKRKACFVVYFLLSLCRRSMFSVTSVVKAFHHGGHREGRKQKAEIRNCSS
jgi:hypothetical protein